MIKTNNWPFSNDILIQQMAFIIPFVTIKIRFILSFPQSKRSRFELNLLFFWQHLRAHQAYVLWNVIQKKSKQLIAITLHLSSFCACHLNIANHWHIAYSYNECSVVVLLVLKLLAIKMCDNKIYELFDCSEFPSESQNLYARNSF